MGCTRVSLGECGQYGTENCMELVVYGGLFQKEWRSTNVHNNDYTRLETGGNGGCGGWNTQVDAWARYIELGSHWQGRGIGSLAGCSLVSATCLTIEE